MDFSIPSALNTRDSCYRRRRRLQTIRNGRWVWNSFVAHVSFCNQNINCLARCLRNNDNTIARALDRTSTMAQKRHMCLEGSLPWLGIMIAPRESIDELTDDSRLTTNEETLECNKKAAIEQTNQLIQHNFLEKHLPPLDVTWFRLMPTKLLVEALI